MNYTSIKTNDNFEDVIFEIIDSLKCFGEISDEFRNAGYSGKGTIYILYPSFDICKLDLNNYSIKLVDTELIANYTTYKVNPNHSIGLYYENSNIPLWLKDNIKIKFIEKSAQQGDAPEPVSNINH